MPGVPDPGHILLFFLARNLLSVCLRKKMRKPVPLKPETSRTLVIKFVDQPEMIEICANIVHYYLITCGKKCKK